LPDTHRCSAPCSAVQSSPRLLPALPARATALVVIVSALGRSPAGHGHECQPRLVCDRHFPRLEAAPVGCLPPIYANLKAAFGPTLPPHPGQSCWRPAPALLPLAGFFEMSGWRLPALPCACP
jgi:hypothetical protein